MSKLEATMVLNQWKVERKAYNDKVQRERRKSVGTDITTSDIEHSGVLIPQLRMMTEVKASPLLVGHTFPSKEPLLLMKTGRPKLDKRLKSPLEGKSKRKRGDVNKEEVGGKRRSPD
jgi:hypothetical protein